MDKALGLTLLSILFSFHTAFSAVTAVEPQAPDKQNQTEAYNPFQHMLQGAQDFPDRTNLLLIGTGSVLALIASQGNWDEQAKSTFRGKRRLGELETLGNEVLGTGAVGASIGIATLSYGLIRGHQKSIHSGEAHLEGLVGTLIGTSVLKLTFQRERPDGSSRNSFPSGHTSTMGCTTAVMGEMYGPALGIPFLALTIATGISRIADNRHYLSDVIFGGILGYATGRAYTLHHQKQHPTSASSETLSANEYDKIRSSPWIVLPVFDDRDHFGVTASHSF